MTSLITIHENIPVVSHRVIAENTNNEQRSIRLLVDEHKADFEEFGRVSFEMTTLQTNGGKQETKTYLLNEQQATLLMTYMKNSPIVREFKKALVRAFFDLREKVLAMPTPSIYTRMIDVRDQLWREAIYMGYNGRCFHTGKCLSFDTFHIDHVLPQSRGGMDTLDNLVLCDPSYNMSKQALILSDMELDSMRRRIIIEFAPKVVALYESKRSGIVTEGLSLNTIMNVGMLKFIKQEMGPRSLKVLLRAMIPILNTPEAIEDERQDQDDTLNGFIECYIVRDQEAKCASKDLYEAYIKWCSQTGEEPLKLIQFTEKFKRMGLGKPKAIRIGSWNGKGYNGFFIAPMGGVL